MARLPDVQPDAVQGTPVPVVTPSPTDFGLTAVGADLNRTEDLRQRAGITQIRAQAKADQAAVQPQLQQLETTLNQQLVTGATNWNGKPGFASDQIAQAQKAIADATTNGQFATPGQRSMFQHLATMRGSAFGEQVNGYERQKLLENAADQQDVEASGALTQFYQAYAPAKQALIDGYDGSQKGLAAAGLAAFDQAQAAALQGAPGAIQPRLQARFALMRQEEAAGLGAVEQKGADAYLFRNTQDQAYGLINTISSNPSAYDSVVSNGLPQVLQNLPAGMEGMKKDLTRELQGMAATARVKGLILKNNPGQAQAELADGRYDQVLTPEAKDALSSTVAAAVRDRSPKSVDQALAQIDIERRAQAETYALLTTGKSSGQITPQDLQQLPLERSAEILSGWSDARNAYAAAGSTREMSTPQLQGISATPPPDPSEPGYAAKLQIWQTSRSAAAAELKARQDPGAWAFTSDAKTPTKGPAAAGDAQGQDRGALLQGLWAQAQQGTPHAAGQLAGWSIGSQQSAGIPRQAWQLIPQSEASRLAAGVVNAQPEQRLQAMQQLGSLVSSFPVAFRLPDGSTANPQAILAHQLLAAHLSPVELSAIVDYGSDPAKLGRVVAAINDPTLKKPLDQKGQEHQLELSVKAAVQPFLATAAPLPGAEDLAQARIDRTTLVARGLMAHQGLSPQAAAQTAAQDLVGGYRYVDGWRMPQGAAATTVDLQGVHDPLGAARAGAAKLLGELTSGNGAGLYAPAGLPGGPDDRRRLYAAQVSHNGRWVTAPDDSGLMLMVPHPDGSWDQVADRYGRPVRMGWSQLQSLGQGVGPSPFAAPPPTALRAPDGKPLPAFSKTDAFMALSSAVEGTESSGVNGQVSPKGAVGLMQVTPATVATYAPRLGLPADPERARTDADYNRRIGNAALGDYVQRYGSGAGLGLALAAYHSGPGNVEGYTDAKGYHPGYLQLYGDPRSGRISLDDWVARVKARNPETGAYIQQVLPRALAKLEGRG